MKNAIIRFIGIALTIVGAFVVLFGFFAAIGASVSQLASERAFLIFACAGFLIVGFLFLAASKMCLSWDWTDLMRVLPPQGLVVMGHITKFLSRVRMWHKCVALIALLFAAGLIWTNLE